MASSLRETMSRITARRALKAINFYPLATLSSEIRSYEFIVCKENSAEI